MSEFLKNSKKVRRLPVAPSMAPTLDAGHLSKAPKPLNKSTIRLCCYAAVVAVFAAFAAQFLTHLIGFFTNIFFHWRFSTEFVGPYSADSWGVWVIAVPIIGGLIVGVMARYGSKAIRGHGIPEAMEQILTNDSRIPLRVTFLKPLSSAISIGTGGPFGAEGPIIATGAALGSSLGQFLKMTANHRKILLAAGAAAGMTATFGSPISAVLLAVELLLFEFKPQSLIPVAVAAAIADSVRIFFVGTEPVFPMEPITGLSPSVLVFSLFIGLVMGVSSTAITKLVYAIEDGFERLPIHWMWWPALGGLVVGIIGYFFPNTLGVGYDNIEHIVSGEMLPMTMVAICSMKFISWSVSLGSGTSGGTLAPLFTFGGGIGALMGYGVLAVYPELGITPGVAALIGMAAIFAGASRALLTSVVFAFEVTQQPLGLMPLLAGCSISYLVSGILMKNSIMTEKIERRGVRVPSEYSPDSLDLSLVRDFASRNICTLPSDLEVEKIFKSIVEHRAPYIHQGYPVLDNQNKLVGIVTSKDLLDLETLEGLKVKDLMSNSPICVYEHQTLREAQNLMIRYKVGRLPVISRDNVTLVGILSRSDLLRA